MDLPGWTIWIIAIAITAAIAINVSQKNKS
jgi:hypothetical protein